MLLNEPPPTAYDVNFRVGPVPVRIHPLYWLTTVFSGIHLKDPKQILLLALAVFISILVHELGHVFAFARYNIQSRVVLHAMGGLAIHYRGYGGWGRYNPYGGRSLAGWPNVFISLAGPLAGFLLA